MALQNPSGIYQGAAPMNPLPYVNIALQARARKQAREEAVDKYYQKLPDTINDKGVRDIEIPIINEGKNKIMEFGVKNREALKDPKKDNGAARLTLDKMIRDLSGVARLSKNAAQVDLTAGKSLMNKDNQFILNNDDYVADHDLHNLPVTDPRHKTLDLTKFAANRPFNQAALIKRNADIKYSDGVPEISDHPTDPLSNVLTTRPVLDEANKATLFSRAANDLHNDPVFANKIKNNLVETGMLNEYAKIAKDVFGIDSKDLNDEALAAAYEYSLLPVKQTTQKRINDTEAIMDKRRKEGMADWKIKEGIRQANRKELFGMQQAAKDAGDSAYDTWIDSYIGKTVSDAKSSGKTQQYKFSDGRKLNGYPIEVDPVMSKVLGFDDKNKGRLMVTEDGKFVPMFYKTDNNYEPITKDGSFIIDGTKTNVLSQDAIKLALGGKAGVKQLNKEMTQPSPAKKEQKTKIVVKKGELDDLN